MPAPVRPQQSNALGLAPIDPLRLLKRYWLWLVIAALVGAVVGFVANAILARVAPQWRTEVYYQVSAPMQDPTQGIALGQDKDEMERFLLTQANVLTSDKILRAALVNSADVFTVQTQWGQNNVVDDSGGVNVGRGLRELKRIASSNVMTGTNLVRLAVTTNQAEDSAQIAKAIHESYWTDWRALTQSQTVESREPILQAINALQQQRQRLEQQRETLLQGTRIDDLRSNQGSAADQEISALQPQVSRAAEEIARLTTLVRQYEAMAAGPGGTVSFPDELRDLVERDPVVIESKQRVTNVRNEIQANTQLGPDHPFNRTLARRLESAESELAAQRETQLRKLFDSELDRSRRGLEASQQVLSEQGRKLEAAVARKQEIARTLALYDQIIADRERVQAEIDRNNQALAAINATSGISNQLASRVDRIRVLVPPQRPDEMAFPQLKIMLPIGIALVVGLTAAFLIGRELLDQRIKGPSDILTIPRVRLLGVIPTADADASRPTPETAFAQSPTGALADAYRQIRAPLLKRMAQAGHKSLLVVAGSPGAGATSVVSNIGMASAASDQRVLLIDANFRKPALHRIFKLAESPGLGEVLNRKITLEQAIQQTNTPNLHLLAAGQAANRALPERLATDLMAQVLAEAGTRYDLIIIDSCPATIAGDAFALANRVDTSVLVVRAKNEKRGLIARLRDQLSDSRGEFAGVIVNGVEAMRSGYMKKNIEAAREYSSTSA
jgi:capsular exopolysaccharide synthesis family protein